MSFYASKIKIGAYIAKKRSTIKEDGAMDGEWKGMVIDTVPEDRQTTWQQPIMSDIPADCDIRLRVK